MTLTERQRLIRRTAAEFARRELAPDNEPAGQQPQGCLTRPALSLVKNSGVRRLRDAKSAQLPQPTMRSGEPAVSPELS